MSSACLSRPTRSIAAILIVAALLLPSARAAQSLVDDPPAQSPPNDRAALPALVAAFYDSSPHALVWFDEQRYRDLLDALQALETHGLDPDHYHLASLRRLAGNPIARDRLATDAWLSAALHLLLGKVDPLRIEPDWTARARHADLIAALRTALERNRVAQELLALAPSHPEYRVLQQELTRLLFTIDDPTRIPTPSRAAGDETPLARADRIERLRANLERWRWLPADLGHRHLRVNIAGYRVERFEAGQLVARHRAIVGRTYRKTPVFSNLVRYVVLNPWWETPMSIAVKDELPMFQRDPGAVRRLGFQVLDREGRTVDPDGIDWRLVPANPFPYRLRQAPGPHNALGRAKVMFPNPHNVYLHDTPRPELFAEQRRTFSSGCVRTQDVISLIDWLLVDDPQWTPQRVRETIDGGRETHITLTQPVPVHILYFTAIAESGQAQYLADVYQRDGPLLAALNRDPHQR